MSIEAMKQALEAHRRKYSDPIYDGISPQAAEEFERDVAALHQAIEQAEQAQPVACEPAPENSLPTWSECTRIIENDDFRKRVKTGLEVQVLDTPRTTPEPTALHRFIYEYDDADAYRSAWFLHRLECVLKEAATPPPRQPLNKVDVACDIQTLCNNGDLPDEMERIADWVAAGKMPPRQPLTDDLERALEGLVNRCNHDADSCNWGEVIAAEASLERVYKSRTIEAAHGIKKGGEA